ncbi:hypothetical protein Esti_006639 [Eimeria stiedai]
MLQPTSMEAAATAAATATAAASRSNSSSNSDSSSRSSNSSSTRGSLPRSAGRGRGVCVVTGWALGSSFTNPDQDTAYELFPLQKQHVYIHLNKLCTDPADDAQVEEKVKDLHRFYQQQQDGGPPSSSSSSKLPRFVTVSSWLTPRDFTMARARAVALGLPQQIGGDMQGEQLYKTVANDGEYSPTA